MAFVLVSVKAELLHQGVSKIQWLKRSLFLSLSRVKGQVCSMQSFWILGFFHLFALPFPRGLTESARLKLVHEHIQISNLRERVRGALVKEKGLIFQVGDNLEVAYLTSIQSFGFN